MFLAETKFPKAHFTKIRVTKLEFHQCLTRISNNDKKIQKFHQPCKTHNFKAINPHESDLDLDRRGNQVLEQISPH